MDITYAIKHLMTNFDSLSFNFTLCNTKLSYPVAMTTTYGAYHTPMASCQHGVTEVSHSPGNVTGNICMVNIGHVKVSQ